MKTDRFADIIRRKLDSIRPEFSERDWARMQAALKQAGPAPNAPTPSTHFFAGQAARLAVAGAIGTAVFLTTTIWQHYELNHLHQTLQQVTQHTNRPKTPAPDADSRAKTGMIDPANPGTNQVGQGNRGGADNSANGPVQHDTVYVDRYVAAPAPAVQPRLNTSPSVVSEAQRSAATDATSQPNGTALPAPATVETFNRLSRRTTNQSVTRLPTTAFPASQRPVNLLEKSGSTDAIANQPAKNQLDLTNPTAGQGNVSVPSSANRLAQTQPATPPSDGSTAGSVTGPIQPQIEYELAAARPMSLSTVHWNELLTQRAKRMRPARTVVVSGQMPAVSQPVQPLAARVRAGAGVEANAKMWSSGVFSELLLGKHWTLGLGLSRAAYKTTIFLNDIDFNQRTHDNFRKIYARGVDPRHDILNIQTHTVQFEVPINIGYRFPLNSSLSLLPSVGTNLTLKRQEYMTFHFGLPFKGYNAVNYLFDRPVDLFNNLTFATSLEWQRKHWVAQASPVLTVPAQSNPRNPQNATAGMRVRLFYQF